MPWMLVMPWQVARPPYVFVLEDFIPEDATVYCRGTKEILSDYLPEIFSAKAVKTTAVYIWTGLSALTFLGLAYLNIYDVGVCKAVGMLWKL